MDHRKVFLASRFIENYLPAGESLPEVPAALPVIEIPEIHFNKVAPLFSNLPEAKQTVDIHPMEQFNQDGELFCIGPHCLKQPPQEPF